jgi:hypothetical protein
MIVGYALIAWQNMTTHESVPIYQLSALPSRRPDQTETIRDRRSAEENPSLERCSASLDVRGPPLHSSPD